VSHTPMSWQIIVIVAKAGGRPFATDMFGRSGVSAALEFSRLLAVESRTHRRLAAGLISANQTRWLNGRMVRCLSGGRGDNSQGSEGVSMTPLSVPLRRVARGRKHRAAERRQHRAWDSSLRRPRCSPFFW
jgi:hypothetical protein